MALIKCSECGREISDKAAACIHCGCPISAARPQTSVNPQQNVGGGTGGTLSLNFHALLPNADTGKTAQRDFVNELGREVEFSINNNTRVGETIRTALMQGSKYDHILFTVTSISRIPATFTAAATTGTPAAAPAATSTPNPAPSPASAPAGKIAIERIKSYKPNWFIQYLRSRRFYTVMFLCVGLAVTLFTEGDLEMAFAGLAGTSPIWLPSLAGKFFYPMHHVKKYFRKNNIEEAIRKDTGYMNVAISAYNAMPGKKMLAYIKGLNQAAGQKIEQQLAANKKN